MNQNDTTREKRKSTKMKKKKKNSFLSPFRCDGNGLIVKQARSVDWRAEGKEKKGPSQIH